MKIGCSRCDDLRFVGLEIDQRRDGGVVDDRYPGQDQGMLFPDLANKGRLAPQGTKDF